MPDPITIPKVYLQLGEYPNPATRGRPIVYCATGNPEADPSVIIGHADPDLNNAIGDACDAYNAQRNAEEK